MSAKTGVGITVNKNYLIANLLLAKKKKGIVLVSFELIGREQSFRVFRRDEKEKGFDL